MSRLERGWVIFGAHLRTELIRRCICVYLHDMLRKPVQQTR